MTSSEFGSNAQEATPESTASANRVLDAVRAGLREAARENPQLITSGFIGDDPEYLERARNWQAERDRLQYSDDPAERRQAMSIGVIPSPEPPIIGNSSYGSFF